LHTKVIELNKIRVGAVSYLNTKPLIYGVKRSGLLMEKIVLSEEYPSKIAAGLLNDEIDVGLVPVAIIPLLKEAHIITDYCIGAEQEVASVGIFSEVPMENIETVLLDYQSRTSVNLAKVLLKHYWKKEVVLQDANEDFREHIGGTTAGVVIGDRALEQRKISKYNYDLAAGWVANKKLPEDFIDAFNRANGFGVHHLDAILAENSFEHYDLKKYYTRNISYALTDEKRKGLEKFLEYL